MATMIQESMDSEYDDVRFPQERTQGLILGLTLEQVIVVLAGVLIGMAFILRGGPAMFVGIGLMAVIGAFGATRFRGRSLPGWVWVAAQYLRRGGHGAAGVPPGDGPGTRAGAGGRRAAGPCERGRAAGPA